MFYAIEQGVLQPLTDREAPQAAVKVGYLELEELQALWESLGLAESAVRECAAQKAHFRSSVDLYDDFTYGIVNIVDVHRTHAPRDRIALFIRRDLFLLVKLVDEDDSVRAMFERAIRRFDQSATLEKVAFGVLDCLLDGGARAAADAEQELEQLERTLVDGRIDRELNRKIFRLRSRLAAQKNYYDQLAQLGQELAENGTGLFPQRSLRYFKLFANRAGRMGGTAQHLCENAIHLREALAAAQDYELNRVMKVFTVVTAIFLPLTLIVGWYGMNFHNMPELSWQYGYPAVIAVSAAVVAGTVFWFKWKKLM